MDVPRKRTLTVNFSDGNIYDKGGEDDQEDKPEDNEIPG